MLSRRSLPTVLVLSLVMGALVSCGTDFAGAPAPPVATAANLDVDFDGSFLAGTARDNGASPGTGDFAPPGRRAEPIARRWVQIGVDAANPVNGALTNAAGLTLYRFDLDTPFTGTSACDARCAREWRPVAVEPDGTVFLSGVPEDSIGHFTREDGLIQLTVEGRPLYLYSGDSVAGDARGHGLDGVWFGVTPDGERADLRTRGVEQ
ncbi:hypothetical protein [Streptomyces sp. NPDC050804]|uniref:COG4315 family predicted lipoprotein n=1 Tax=Streptomyces sp. NPDC050804 TaxID=3154745 RepID=UPI0034340E87